jgi:membrane associated rhomboid family serine protease
MRLLKTYWLPISLALLGVVVGLVYWNWWGCTDSCPLWSKAHWMALRGGVMGLCLGIIFTGFKRKKTDNPSES